MKVTRLKMTPLKFPKVARKVPIHSVNPVHLFTDMGPGLAPWERLPQPDHPDLVVLEVETDEGITGVATTGSAVASVYPCIEAYLAPLIVGQNPFDTELLWEKMFRYGIGWGREGVGSLAMAVVDVALWDLKGKAFNQPVYNLLGGKTKDTLRVYASRLYGPDTGVLREEAAMYVEQGFTAMKQRFAYGPVHGIDGMKKNRELVETVRKTIGDDIELMVDCCRAFDPVYAIKMAHMVEEFHLTWLEEPVLPHDHAGYVQVRQAVSMPVSGGENEYSKHAFFRWAELGCADIWQPDVQRAAGLTEVQKIVHLAASHGIQVILHGGWVTNFHLTMANINMPMAEYFPSEPESAGMNVFRGEPLAKNGCIKLSDKPGFGRELNAEVLKKFAYQ